MGVPVNCALRTQAFGAMSGGDAAIYLEDVNDGHENH